VAPIGNASAVTTLDVSAVNSRRERHFSLSKTIAGSYEVAVKLYNDHLGSSPYIIHILGGPPVNHLGGRVWKHPEVMFHWCFIAELYCDC
jgi:hypothetical protein